MSKLRYKKGDKIGERYEVHEAFMGGMGEVYLCLDLDTTYPYALKTLQARYLTMPQVRNLFHQEVAIWIALPKHPHIVRCHFMKIVENQPFMFLEWIANDEGRGTNLRSWLQHGALDRRLVLDFAIDICRGLLHAHQSGIVHRDLKPENVLIAQGRVAKITDFGLAQVKAVLHTEDDQNLLGKLRLAGTPPYMAPEQWRGERLDGRTDIYAFGCLLYEMLTGRWPYLSSTRADFRRQHLNADIPKVADDDHFSIQPLLNRCLAKRSEQRFATVGDLLQQLTLIYKQQFAESPRVITISQEFTAIEYNNRGYTYQKLDRYVEALVDYTRAIQLDPTYAKAYSNRAVTYDKLKLYDKALKDHHRAIQLNPTDAQIYANRGATYDKLQRYEDALADYNRAIELDPTQAKPYSNRGVTLANLKHYDKALADFNRAIQIEPTYALAYSNRGYIHARVKQVDQALADYTTAIKIEPTLTLAYINRATLYRWLGRYNKALADYTKAIELDPTNGLSYANRGQIYAILARYHEALADLNQAIQLDPTESQSYIQRGQIYAILARYHEALADYSQAIKLNPNHAQPYANRGNIYHNLQRYDDALADYLQAIQLDPTLAQAYLNLGVILANRGTLREALPYFEKAAQLGHPQGAEFAAQARQMLEPATVLPPKRHQMA